MREGYTLHFWILLFKVPLDFGREISSIVGPFFFKQWCRNKSQLNEFTVLKQKFGLWDCTSGIHAQSACRRIFRPLKLMGSVVTVVTSAQFLIWAPGMQSPALGIQICKIAFKYLKERKLTTPASKKFLEVHAIWRIKCFQLLFQTLFLTAFI